MNWIELSANKIAKIIRENYPYAASEKVLIYSLSLLINTTTAILATLLICFYTGHLSEAFITIMIFLLLRYLSGGFHLKSAVACCMFSTCLLIGLSHVNFEYLKYGPILDTVSIIIFILKAPEGLENVSRINPKFYPLLKILCVILVGMNFFLHSSLLSAIFIAQAFTLTKIAYLLVFLLESRWNSEI
ncbi:accessory gene regulator B family protein [Paenibacillus sp. A3]|uniref:accessory gene regulator B family protein n=1 Tax=Paenibacillus sp. A3 TaxID=1337054 RepID=UPI0009EA81C9